MLLLAICSITTKFFMVQLCSSVCRQQDVRATEIDKVDMFQSYRPGDIVRALVVSLRGKYGAPI